MTWSIEIPGPIVDAEIAALAKEIRLNGRDGITNAVHVTIGGRRIVVIYAFFKKAAKTTSDRNYTIQGKAQLLR